MNNIYIINHVDPLQNHYKIAIEKFKIFFSKKISINTIWKYSFKQDIFHGKKLTVWNSRRGRLTFTCKYNRKDTRYYHQYITMTFTYQKLISHNMTFNFFPLSLKLHRRMFITTFQTSDTFQERRSNFCNRDRQWSRGLRSPVIRTQTRSKYRRNVDRKKADS